MTMISDFLFNFIVTKSLVSVVLRSKRFLTNSLYSVYLTTLYLTTLLNLLKPS